jgi:hypothetical protein
MCSAQCFREQVSPVKGIQSFSLKLKTGTAKRLMGLTDESSILSPPLIEVDSLKVER